MFGDRRELELEIREELALPEISFDLENVCLEGVYSDELSAHRAKKVWIDALERHFLLEESGDYTINVRSTEEETLRFALKCQFSSACARYAFWRLTNNQAPEAEYVLETAHLPLSEESWLEFQTAPDSIQYEYGDQSPPLFLDRRNRELKLNKGWFDSFESILQKLVRTFEIDKD